MKKIKTISGSLDYKGQTVYNVTEDASEFGGVWIEGNRFVANDNYETVEEEDEDCFIDVKENPSGYVGFVDGVK